MVALAEMGQSRKASPCLLHGGVERVDLALNILKEEYQSSDAHRKHVGKWICDCEGYWA